MIHRRPPLDLAVGAAAERTGSGDMVQVVLDSLPDPIHVVDRGWRVIYANDAFMRHMTMDRVQVVGSSLWDLIPRSRAARLEEAFARVIATGKTESFVH